MIRSTHLPRPTLVALLLAAFACDAEPTPGPAPSASATAAPLAAGTRVVAAVTKVSFREGVVVSSDDQRVTIAIGPARQVADAGAIPTQTVRRDAVWPLQAADADAVAREAAKKGGDHGICKLDLTERAGALPAWHPCEITGGAGGKLRVRDAYGRRHTLVPELVVLPDPPVRATIADYLARERRHRAFDEAFEGAGLPFRPEGWEPTAGEAVVVHFVGPSWYGGQVVEHKRDKGKVRVRYDGGTWDDRDVPLDEVAPLPSATKAPPVAAGAYAMVRPDKPTKRWEPVEVRSVSDDEVVVVDRDEQERRVKRAELLPIVAAKPSPQP